MLKIIEPKEIVKDFYVEVPERLKCLSLRPTRIKIRAKRKIFEYVYIPYNFLGSTFLTIEELEAIVKRIKELNKDLRGKNATK